MVLGRGVGGPWYCLTSVFLLGKEVEGKFKPAFFVSGLKVKGLSRTIRCREQCKSNLLL